MATYPAGLPSFATLVDSVDDVLASHQNSPNAEIVAIATELGVAPKTIDDTVTPGASPTSVANYLDMLANIVKTIAGAANWYSAAVSMALSYAENLLSGDVTLTNANTFYDGPSLSLAAGTWFLSGQVVVLDSVSSANFAAKLWDGSTVESSAEVAAQAGYIHELALSGVVVLTGTTTYKISVASNAATNGKIKAACQTNGAGNNASRLTAIKIA